MYQAKVKRQLVLGDTDLLLISYLGCPSSWFDCFSFSCSNSIQFGVKGRHFLGGFDVTHDQCSSVHLITIDLFVAIVVYTYGPACKHIFCEDAAIWMEAYSK